MRRGREKFWLWKANLSQEYLVLQGRSEVGSSGAWDFAPLVLKGSSWDLRYPLQLWTGGIGCDTETRARLTPKLGF